MNILFFTREEVSPYKGGTERITHTRSGVLRKKYGHQCFSAYLMPALSTTILTEFDGKLHVNRYAVGYCVKRFVEQNSIERIIIQGELNFVSVIRKALKKQRNCRIIFVHHFEPGFEKHFFRLCDVRDSIQRKEGLNKLPHIFQFLLYPILHSCFIKRLPKRYQVAYRDSDSVVLLSERYRQGFMQFGGVLDSSKFSYIPNMLSYSRFASEKELSKKEKTVLIVSRLDERKRLSWALNMWKQIKEYVEADGWTLRIVGDGEHRKLYYDIVREQNIKDVHFLGRMEPVNEYERASLFMMTSASEGWGLTLTEAQQFGCVPIAFDSYLSLHDIITNEENGCIVPEGDINAYVHTLLYLMKYTDVRMQMARSCIVSAHRYGIEKVVENWEALLSELD